MNAPITMMKPIAIRTQMYQFSVTHWATVSRVSLFKRRFFRRNNGPSASTARHFRNTSQYPWKLSHGDPGRRLIPPSGRPYKWANSLVLRQVDVSLPFWHANSHNRRLSTAGVIDDVRKHSDIFQSKQIDPEHSPLIHNAVPLLHFVLSSLGLGSGHSGVVPLHVLDQEHSVSSLHLI